MAKPILPEKLKRRMRAGKAAAKLLEAKLREVAAYLPAALTGDVGGVHDMRVAVKRLREALRLFRRLLPRRRRERLMPLVEELNEGLGAVRDPDVMRAHLAATGARVSAAAQFCADIQERWLAERTRAHEEFVSLWQRLEESERLLPRLKRLAERTGERCGKLNDLRLDQFAYLAILARAKQVETRRVEFAASSSPVALHSLRIAVKRLKYSMEPFLLVLPDLTGPYEVVAGAQEALGLTHDLDVLASAISEYLARPALANQQAAQQLLGAIRARREESYRTATEYVARLAGEAWHKTLMDSVE